MMAHDSRGPVPELTGTTSLIFHVGDPIHQVRTPSTLNPDLAARGVHAAIVPLNLRSEDFDKTMPGLMAGANVAGFIFTVPFKAQALPLVNEIGPVAWAAGGINAMRKERDGRWVGDQFDGAGFVAALRDEQVPIEKRRVLLVGAGGAGKAIALALAEAGVATIDVCDIDADRRDRTMASVRALAPECRVEPARAIVKGHDIIVNATPLGMADTDPLPIALDAVGSGQTVFDIIPTPEVTQLMRRAQDQGARVLGGRLMVRGQAKALLGFFGLAG